jgi:hypothetical protein
MLVQVVPDSLENLRNCSVRLERLNVRQQIRTACFFEALLLGGPRQRGRHPIVGLLCSLC